MEDLNKDFLLKRTPVTKVQLVGLLLSALFLLSVGISIWVLFVSKSLGSSDLLGIAVLVVGSAVSAFLIYLAWLNIRRIFAGRTSRR